MLPNNKSSARSASAFSSASACESVLLCGQKWRSQRKQMCLLFIVYIIQQKKKRKISQLWHFSHRRQTRNISMRKSPKIVSIVGFLLSFPLFRLPFCPLTVNPSVISFQLGRQFSKNEAHTTEPKGTQRRTSSIRRRSPKEADEEESTTPAMGKWQHWCFGNMCKQLRSIGGRGRAGDADLVDC